MMQLRQRWQLMLQKVDAMSQRERMLIFAALLAFFYGVANLLMLPFDKNQAALKNQLDNDNKQISAAVDEINARLSKAAKDPNIALRAREQDIQQQIARLQQDLQTRQQFLVAAESVPGLLQNLLREHQQVQLRSMRSLPLRTMRIHADGAMHEEAAPAPDDPALARERAMREHVLKGQGSGKVEQALAAAQQEAVQNAAKLLPGGADANLPSQIAAKAATQQAAAPAPDLPRIYQHELELELSGAYADLMRYLQALEKLPNRLYWSQARLQVDEHPRCTLRLRVYTLSLDQKWLTL
ncbi:hypothetical protein V8J88_06800 [Massilia sp. W12]|uniref:hypothetical protein n=1 Tax=Massilia sp. W12 TaxID=3126507 RepID=UPI0030CBB6F9